MRFQQNPYEWQKPFRFADPQLNIQEEEQPFDIHHPFANMPTTYGLPNQIPNIFDQIMKSKLPATPSTRNPYEEEEIWRHLVPRFNPPGREGEPFLDRSKSKSKREAGRLGMEAAMAMQQPDRPRDPNLKELGLALLPMLFGAGTRYFGPMAQSFMESRDNEEQRRYAEFQRDVQKKISKAQLDYDEEGRLRQDEDEDYTNLHNKFESDYQRKYFDAEQQYEFDKIGYFQDKDPQEHEKLKSIFDRSQSMWKDRVAKIEEDGIVTEEEVINALKAQQQLVGMFGSKYAGHFRIPEMGATEARQADVTKRRRIQEGNGKKLFSTFLETIPRGEVIDEDHQKLFYDWIRNHPDIDPRTLPEFEIGANWKDWIGQNGLQVRDQKDRFQRMPSRQEIEQQLYDINNSGVINKALRGLFPFIPDIPSPDTSSLHKFRKLYIGGQKGTRTDPTVEKFVAERQRAIAANEWDQESEDAFRKYFLDQYGINLNRDLKAPR